jgi:hypothetical protein
MQVYGAEGIGLKLPAEEVEDDGMDVDVDIPSGEDQPGGHVLSSEEEDDEAQFIPSEHLRRGGASRDQGNGNFAG